MFKAALAKLKPKSLEQAYVYLRLGKLYLVQKRFDNAASAIQQCVQIREKQLGVEKVDTQSAMFLQSFSELIRGRVSDAECILEHAAERPLNEAALNDKTTLLNDWSASLHSMLGNEYFIDSEFDSAEYSFKYAISHVKKGSKSELLLSDCTKILATIQDRRSFTAKLTSKERRVEKIRWRRKMVRLIQQEFSPNHPFFDSITEPF